MDTAADFEEERPETLDGELWSTLPQDLILSILAWLPLKDLARYRTVCKKWQEIWHSPALMKVRSRVPAEKSWFIFNRLEHVTFMGIQQRDLPDSPSLCYNPGVNKWHTLMYLPASIERVAATAGGLMFCVKRPVVTRSRIAVVFWNWPEMIVCNPLKENCYTKLPERHCNWKPHTIGMVVDSKANTFKIVLATVHQGTEIYDSSKKRWKLLESCRPPALSYHPEAISHKGCIYSVGVGAMFVFDVEQEVWSSFDLPHPEREIRNTQLYDCEGRLLLVGCLRSGDAGEEARMIVWELSGGVSSSGVWKELSSVSIQDVRTGFCPDSNEHGRHNDLLFVRGLNLNVDHQQLCMTRGGDWIMEEASHEKAFLYSLSHNAWYFVDESPTYSQRLIQYQGEGLRFEPKIEASV